MIQNFHFWACSPKFGNIHTYLYISVHNIIHRSQKVEGKQPKCLMTEELINKMWAIPKIEYNSTFKIKEILTDAAIWVYLKAITGCEISQLQEKNTVKFYLYELFKVEVAMC